MTDTIHQNMIDRLFAVFRDSPNVQYFIEVLAGPMDDTWTAIQYYLDNTDIDDCTGELLDFRGWTIGVRRPPLQETNVFTLTDADTMIDYDNKHGFYNSNDGTGGYMTSEDGLANVADPSLTMADDDYRILIKTKAASFRKRATPENLYSYFLAYEARCDILEAD